MEYPVSDIYSIDIPESKSSMIKKIDYDFDLCILTIYFRKYYCEKQSFVNVSKETLKNLIESESIGKYFLYSIKTKYKKMANESKKPKTKNQASNSKRFIKISVDVTKINKEWIHSGEKGNYLNLTLMMLPDGETDTYGNLGMIVQDVPKSVYEKDKSVKGPILGNGCEFDYAKSEGLPGSETGSFVSSDDDLPF